MDWAEFFSVTTAAATLATAIATGVTLWLRQRDKPEAEWEIKHERVQLPKGDEADDAPKYQRMVRTLFEVLNAGDGNAHLVRVSGIECFAEHAVLTETGRSPQTAPFKPVVEPGSSFLVRTYHPVGAYSNGAWLRIEWVPAPTRVSKPIIEVIPLREARTHASTAEYADPTEWRYRELRRWQLRQRMRQWAATRQRQATLTRSLEQRRSMQRWLEAAPPWRKPGSEPGKSEIE